MPDSCMSHDYGDWEVIGGSENEEHIKMMKRILEDI